jgi:chaperonin GroES
MGTKFRPLGTRVVVRRQTAEDKSKGGILIPEQAQKRPFQGEVLAVGAGRLSDQGVMLLPAVKVGDVVLWGQYAGQEVTLDDGEKATLLGSDDIFGVLETIPETVD